MILNSIALENIRSYKKETIEFPRGITLFEGEIGSGKSSVLMGIEFALFGLGSQRPEALLSKKANEGGVTLNFEVNGKTYEIRRILKRKGDTVSQDPKHSYLKINDELEPLSPTELKQKVLQILNFNEPGDPRSESKIFRYAIFTPQEQMKQILQDSAKRLETIRKAFGVEDYKIAVENAKNFLNSLDKQISIFKERFKEIEKYKTELKSCETVITEINNSIQKFEKQEENLNIQKKETELELNKLREKSQQHIELTIKKENIVSKIHDKKNELGKIVKNIDQIKDEIANLNDELEKLRKIKKPTTKTVEKITEMIKQFSESDKKIASLQSRKASLSNQSRRLGANLGTYFHSNVEILNKTLKQIAETFDLEKDRFKKLAQEIKEKTKVKTKLEANIEKFEEDINIVSKLGAKCPYCEHELTKEHKQKLAKERQQKLLKARSDLSAVNTEMSSMESNHSKLENKIIDTKERISEIERIIPDMRSFESISNELKEIEDELMNLEGKRIIPEEKNFDAITKYEGPVEYLNALKDTLLEYQNAENRIKEVEKRHFKVLKDKEEIESELLKKSNDITELESVLEKISSSIESFAEIDKKLHMLEIKKKQLDRDIILSSNKIAVDKESRKNQEAKMREILDKITYAQKWQQTHRKYSNYYDWIKEFFVPTVEQIEKQVLLSIQQDFNDTYRRWYSILIDDPTKESRIDENFTPLVEQDGYEQEVDFLSGGEKTSIALAYRLALNSLMRQQSDCMKSNLLILDEPTDGFSKTQLAKVKTLLLELKSQQIILVSHEKELETYVDNVFQIIKDSGASRVKRLNN